ncbi:hypothetical protein BKA63DRAFT_19392 [Paraphoma chrysanthemicola]|nr:hypothetical protein BKA63DRAFT_19392 [Paraphoma chrysanthemicola]
MSGGWREAQDRIVNLPDDEPAIFRRYIYLLYTGALAVVPDLVPEKYSGHDEHINLTRLYVLAEKLRDIDSKNCVIQACVVRWQQLHNGGRRYAPGETVIGLIYHGTPAGSQFRKLLVDVYTYRARSKWLRDAEMVWPSDFLSELALNLLDQRVTPMSDWIADPLAYVEASENSAS